MQYQVIFKDSKEVISTFDYESEARYYICKHVSFVTHYINKQTK